MADDAWIPPADRETLAGLFKEHDFDRMECQDHDGRCCPTGHHDLRVSQYEHYVDAVLVPVISACAESPTRPAREPSDG